MKRGPTAPTGPETAAERLARAAALQAALVGGFAREREERAARDAEAGARAGQAVFEGLDPATRAVLAALDLHARRYGLAPHVRTELRRMGARDLAELADTPLDRVVSWLGYREAGAVRGRVAAIVDRIRAGAPEPGIVRMVEGLDDETRSWLLDRPVEDLSGRGIARKVALALRGAGHATVGAVATEESDLIEDIHGIGPATVEALRARISGIVAEGADAPSRGRRRRMSAEDAEWDAAAPEDG